MDDNPGFELEGPVLAGETPPPPATGKESSFDFTDEDAFQMKLL
jgi:hypothetical protein